MCIKRHSRKPNHLYLPKNSQIWWSRDVRSASKESVYSLWIRLLNNSYMLRKAQILPPDSKTFSTCSDSWWRWGLFDILLWPAGGFRASWRASSPAGLLGAPMSLSVIHLTDSSLCCCDLQLSEAQWDPVIYFTFFTFHNTNKWTTTTKNVTYV